MLGDHPSTRTPKSELDKFCCLPLEPLEVDPHKWWKTNRSIFSELGKVAIKMLCFPPSSEANKSLSRERTPFHALVEISTHRTAPHHTALQPNNAGDWGEIDASERQFQLQETY